MVPGLVAGEASCRMTSTTCEGQQGAHLVRPAGRCWEQGCEAPQPQVVRAAASAAPTPWRAPPEPSPGPCCGRSTLKHAPGTAATGATTPQPATAGRCPPPHPTQHTHRKPAPAAASAAAPLCLPSSPGRRRGSWRSCCAPEGCRQTAGGGGRGRGWWAGGCEGFGGSVAGGRGGGSVCVSAGAWAAKVGKPEPRAGSRCLGSASPSGAGIRRTWGQAAVRVMPCLARRGAKDRVKWTTPAFAAA
jgi:hypothetical protein